MSKLVVLFPGVRYSCDTPLLYYAGSAFEQRGYQVGRVSCGDALGSTEDLEQGVLSVRDGVLEQVRRLAPERREDVVFVSKSVGTVLAGWTAAHLACPVRQICLTPLEGALPYIHPKRDRVVGAGADPFLDGERLKAFCQEKGVPLELFSGVGHRLEDRQDIRRTLNILTEIVHIYEEF